MPLIYDKLAESNPLIAQELLILPDIIDGVDLKEVKGIERLVLSYESMPEAFNSAYRHIHQIGKPEIRPYNTILQSILWIYIDEKNIESAEKIIKNWGMDRESSLVRTHLGLDAEGLLNLSWFYIDPKKWGDIDTIKRRLNSPETISYYTDRQCRFEKYFGSKKSISRVMREKKANCVDESILIKQLLEKSGYKSKLLLVKMNDPRGHVIVGYEDRGKKYIIDNGRPLESGIQGPFNKYADSGYTFMTNRRYPTVD